MKKVVLIVASQGYQPTEYAVPKNILEAAGLTVITASDIAGRAQAKDGSETTVDIVLENVHPKEYDGVFIIGGPGALEHLDNQEMNRILNEALVLEIPYGGICISARILAKAHAITGKKATGWNGDNELEKIFAQYNVAYVPEEVVVDGKLITAEGPHAAQRFGEAIKELVLQK